MRIALSVSVVQVARVDETWETLPVPLAEPPNQGGSGVGERSRSMGRILARDATFAAPEPANQRDQCRAGPVAVRYSAEAGPGSGLATASVRTKPCPHSPVLPLPPCLP
jgi:hypothetical protein